MHALFKSLLCMVMMTVAVRFAQAQNQEAPPMEPPYTNDSEFDPLQGEDPTSSSPIPVSPSNEPAPQTQQAPPVESSEPPVVSSQRASPPTSGKGLKPEKGVRYLHHPDVKKGLIKIEADGTYVYKIKTKKSHETGTLRIGIMEPPKITAADGIHDFASMYGSSGMMTVLMEYEWQPFSKYGKFGVQAGLGFATAEGQGFFLNDAVTVPQEKYTFYAVPVNLGLIYRFEYFKRQWIAPYVSGGGSFIGVAELRDDNRNNFAGTAAGYGAGGLMFNISAMDKNLAFNLSNEYNIANLWLIAEYRYQQSFSEDLNFSGGIMTLGIGADF